MAVIDSVIRCQPLRRLPLGVRDASADAGCDPGEIAAITGHATLKEVQRYTNERDRKLAAQRAMQKHQAHLRNRSVKPVRRV